MLIKFEILKIIRNRLWQLLFVLLLIIHAALIFLQPVLSDNPVMRNRQMADEFLSEVRDQSVEEKSSWFSALNHQYENARTLMSERIMAGLNPEEEFQFSLNPEELARAGILLEEAGEDFSEQQNIVQSLAVSYSQLAGYGEYLQSIHERVEDIRKTPVWRTWP